MTHCHLKLVKSEQIWLESEQICSELTNSDQIWWVSVKYWQFQNIFKMQHNTECDQRVLDIPENHRTLHHVWIAQLGVSVPPIPPSVFMPPAIVPPPIYSHLPVHLAQQYDALPDLYPSVAPGLAPAFLPAPAHYSHLSADLTHHVAALPSLMECSRGRGRGRRQKQRQRQRKWHNCSRSLAISEIAAQYAALPSETYFLLKEVFIFKFNFFFLVNLR